MSLMSLTTTVVAPRRVTSARCSPGVGVDVHDSGTAGTEAVVPGDGLGNAPADGCAPPVAEAAVDGEVDGEGCEAVEVEPQATRAVSATRADPRSRFFKRPRIVREAPGRSISAVEESVPATPESRPISSLLPQRRSE